MPNLAKGTSDEPDSKSSPLHSAFLPASVALLFGADSVFVTVWPEDRFSILATPFEDDEDVTERAI